MPVHRTIALFAVLASGIGVVAGSAVQADDRPVYEVYAVRYGTLPDFPVAALVKGADADRKLDIAMTIWVLKASGGKTVLVDSGFYRVGVLPRWPDVKDFTRPDKALAPLGIKPEDVTDVIITHMHWDHADGADLFPKARIWIQKDEYDHYTKNIKLPAADSKEELNHLSALVKLNAEGRVERVDGDDKEILPGIRVYTGGRHTFASQYVGVNTKRGRMIIASDNVYLYENLDKHVPIAQTLDAKANLAAQDRMKQLAAKHQMIIPGHDPEVFATYPKPGGGVARLD
jgi:glyoxylase-like metal-dependent hydrolase (beta-lactamase superfamily II)